MSAQTRTALESFWEYLAFVMNSLVFLLIGLEVHLDALAHAWCPVLFAIAAVLIGRSLSSCSFSFHLVFCPRESNFSNQNSYHRGPFC